jgi:hypothetical protein
VRELRLVAGLPAIGFLEGVASGNQTEALDQIDGWATTVPAPFDQLVAQGQVHLAPPIIWMATLSINLWPAAEAIQPGFIVYIEPAKAETET